MSSKVIVLGAVLIGMAILVVLQLQKVQTDQSHKAAIARETAAENAAESSSSKAYLDAVKSQ